MSNYSSGLKLKSSKGGPCKLRQTRLVEGKGGSTT